MRIRRRWPALYFFLLLLGAAVAAGFYIYDVGFNQKYRRLIADELARYGLRAEIGKLTLDPVEGLTARNVRLYDVADADTPLADVSRISLDIDFGRLVSRQDFLRSFTLQKASILLPVNPADRATEWITVEDLDARLVVERDRITVARLEAVMAGIRLRLNGTVTLPPKREGQPEPVAAVKARQDKQLRELRDRHGILRSALRVLDRCTIMEDAAGTKMAVYKGELDLEVNGPLGDPDALEIRASIRGQHVRCGNFIAEDYGAEAVLSAGELNLRRLSVRDSHGALAAGATWHMKQSRSIELAVDSSIDLVALIKGLHPGAQLPDDIQFDEPPKFRAEGTFLTGAPFAAGAPPVNLTGALTLGAFRLHGTPYEHLHTDFRVREDGFIYLRNASLKHATGKVAGQFMMGDGMLRYEGEAAVSPAALRPLLARPELKKALALFDFPADSMLNFKVRGDRSEEGGAWQHKGSLDARNIALQGSPLRQVSMGFSVITGGRDTITLTDCLLRREDGDITAKQAVIDLNAGLLHLTEAVSTATPSTTAGMFAPFVGKALEHYYFATPPRVQLAGIIDLRPLNRIDLKLRLDCNGLCGLPVGHDDLRLSGANGTLHVHGGLLHLDLSTRVASGQSFAGIVRCEGETPARILGTFGILKENFHSATKYTVRIRGEDPVVVVLAGKALPVEQVDATIRADAGHMTVSAGGLLYSGSMGVALDFPDQSKPAHSGKVVLERTGFSRLSAAIGSASTTGGYITSKAEWRTPDGRGETIEATGTAALEDANVFALPLMGPLSGLIATLLPGGQLAYSVARKATTTFSIKEGVVTLPDFEASTRTFKLMASGSVDLIRSRVDAKARVNLRGAPGFLLYPVSKLFEYKAEGTTANPGWRALYIPNPLDLLPGRRDKDLDKDKDKDKP